MSHAELTEEQIANATEQFILDLFNYDPEIENLCIEEFKDIPQLELAEHVEVEEKQLYPDLLSKFSNYGVNIIIPKNEINDWITDRIESNKNRNDVLFSVSTSMELRRNNCLAIPIDCIRRNYNLLAEDAIERRKLKVMQTKRYNDLSVDVWLKTGGKQYFCLFCLETHTSFTSVVYKSIRIRDKFCLNNELDLLLSKSVKYCMECCKLLNTSIFTVNPPCKYNYTCPGKCKENFKKKSRMCKRCCRRVPMDDTIISSDCLFCFDCFLKR